MDQKKIIPLLKETPIFAKTSESSLRTMLKSAIEKTVKAGDKLVGKGERGTGFYLIIDGQADVMAGDQKLASFKEGDFFGELAVIDGAPRTADVVAIEDTTCIVVSQWAMRSIISSHSEIALSILEELVERLRKTDAAHSSEA
jgi:CRP/FNR family cyclic AMP-dependent transcriptional regulator